MQIHDYKILNATKNKYKNDVTVKNNRVSYRERVVKELNQR